MSKPTYDELVAALENLAQQADEDCPSEYRTRHLREALTEAFELVEKARA